MEDKKTNEVVDQFCEYQYLSGEWQLVNSHTHEGYYCSGYEENLERDTPQPGDIANRLDLERPAFPSANRDELHRRFGIYKLEVDEEESVTAIPTHQWATMNQNIFPLDLFSILTSSGQVQMVEALKDAALSADEASIVLEVAISEDDIRGQSVRVPRIHREFNPDLGHCVYECHGINGNWTYLPVVGSCLADSSEVSTDYFPTDLMDYLQRQGQTERKRKLEEIGEAYYGTTRCHFRIVVSAKPIEEA